MQADSCASARAQLQREKLELSRVLERTNNEMKKATDEHGALKAAFADLKTAREECANKTASSEQVQQETVRASEQAASKLREQLGQAISEKQMLSSQCETDREKHGAERAAAERELSEAQATIKEAEVAAKARIPVSIWCSSWATCSASHHAL